MFRAVWIRRTPAIKTKCFGKAHHVSLLRVAAAMISGLIAVAANGQQTPPVLGPGPRLTVAKAMADLREAKIITPQITAAIGNKISAQDFAVLMLRTLAVDPKQVLKRTTAATATADEAAKAVKALQYSGNLKSFDKPTAPITREDAVATAMTAAAAKGALRAGTRPKVYPPFADDAKFSNPNSRELAHEAVFGNLMQIQPDNLFRPGDPLLYGDAAYLLDAIRLSALSPQPE
jgi:hypothetical protein